MDKSETLKQKKPVKELSLRELWQVPLFRDFVYILALGIGTWVIFSLWRIFFPLTVALLLSYVFSGWIRTLEKKLPVSRKIICLCIVILSTAFLAAFLVWLGPLVSSQSQLLIQKFPSYLNAFKEQTGIDVTGLVPQQLIDINLGEFWTNLSGTLENTGKLWGVLKDLFTNATYILFNLIVIPIYWYFIMYNFENMVHFIMNYIPATKRERTRSVVLKMDRTASSFFRGRIMIALVMGAMFSIGWWIAGVPFWFLLGMITGILNIIPYASVVGWPFAILLKYLDSVEQAAAIDFMSIVFWPSFVYGLVQFIEGWILTPWIQGEQTDLSVAAVLVVVFIGGYVGGVLGLLIAIPVAACIKIFIAEVVLPRLKAWAEEH